MSDDDLEAAGRVRIPTKWAVGVITALATALGGSGAGAYKMGKLETEVAMLKQLCSDRISADRSLDEAQKSP